MINEYYAKRFCKEDISKIENYDKAIADTTQTWHCHHRTEIWWNCTAQDLIDNECYYNRKACELIFLTPSEHKCLHRKGRTLSEETRQKISESNKGKTGKRHTEEWCRKISEANKGEKNAFYGKHHTEESRRKMSESKKGRPSWNKGRTASIETRVKIAKSHKGKKLSEETKKKIADAAKKRWENKKEVI